MPSIIIPLYDFCTSWFEEKKHYIQVDQSPQLDQKGSAVVVVGMVLAVVVVVVDNVVVPVVIGKVWVGVVIGGLIPR